MYIYGVDARPINTNMPITGIQDPEHHQAYCYAALDLFEHLTDADTNTENGVYYKILNRQDIRDNNVTGFGEWDQEDGVFSNHQTGICILGLGLVHHRQSGDDNNNNYIEKQLFYIKPVNSQRDNGTPGPTIEYQIFLANGTKVGNSQLSYRRIPHELHQLYVEPALAAERSRLSDIASRQRMMPADVYRQTINNNYIDRPPATGGYGNDDDDDIRRMMSSLNSDGREYPAYPAG
jgi:hypothetical protein